jgi:hypothetical protein
MDAMQENKLNPNEPPTSPNKLNPNEPPNPFANWDGWDTLGHNIRWWKPMMEEDEEDEPWHAPTSPSYSPTSPSNWPRDPPREQTQAEWFSETLKELLAKRKEDKYVYAFDKQQDDVCFTANLQEYIDHNAKIGYVYEMQD